MKRIVFFTIVLYAVASSAIAQTGCGSSSTPSGNIVFFGIDYSLVRFSYISESASYTKRTMHEINRLFIIEAKKYDVAKLMRKTVTKIDLDYTNSVIDNLIEDHLIVNSDYKISADDVKTLIAKYPNSASEGIGLVFVAEQMSKLSQTGSYYVTFFDLKTKEVLTTCRKTGKAGGFGMRNYWAASIYNLMKSWR